MSCSYVLGILPGARWRRGILRQIAGDEYVVSSAGTQPKGIDPRTIEVMDEIDVDIRRQRSKGVDEFLTQQVDYAITLCDRAKERCPTFAGLLRYTGASMIRRKPRVIEIWRLDSSVKCGTRFRGGFGCGYESASVKPFC